MELSLYWFLRRVPLAFRLYMIAGKIFDALSIDAPQDIKEKYALKRRRVHDKISKKYPEELVAEKGSKFSQKVITSYRYYADKFEFEAKRKWGRPSQRYAYESAWSYSLAAEFYERAGNNRDASDNYHYAGNAFRNLDAINQAISHYQKSADLADSRDQWKLRNENRAKALKRIIGEEDG